MAVDPYPHYAALREIDPVHHSAMGFWVLTRHADVQAFFADRRLEHQYVLTQMARVGPDIESQPYCDLFGIWSSCSTTRITDGSASCSRRRSPRSECTAYANGCK